MAKHTTRKARIDNRLVTQVLYEGDWLTITQLALIVGVSRQSMYRRVNLGLPLDYVPPGSQSAADNSAEDEVEVFHVESSVRAHAIDPVLCEFAAVPAPASDAR